MKVVLPQRWGEVPAEISHPVIAEGLGKVSTSWSFTVEMEESSVRKVVFAK